MIYLFFHLLIHIDWLNDWLLIDWLLYMFLRSFTHSLINSSIHSFLHPFPCPPVGLRKTMLRAHRQAWCWQDEYHGLTMDDIRRLERETQLALQAKMTSHDDGVPLVDELANGASCDDLHHSVEGIRMAIDPVDQVSVDQIDPVSVVSLSSAHRFSCTAASRLSLATPTHPRVSMTSSGGRVSMTSSGGRVSMTSSGGRGMSHASLREYFGGEWIRDWVDWPISMGIYFSLEVLRA